MTDIWRNALRGARHGNVNEYDPLTAAQNNGFLSCVFHAVHAYALLLAQGTTLNKLPPINAKYSPVLRVARTPDLMGTNNPVRPVKQSYLVSVYSSPNLTETIRCPDCYLRHSRETRGGRYDCDTNVLQDTRFPSGFSRKKREAGQVMRYHF